MADHITIAARVEEAQLKIDMIFAVLMNVKCDLSVYTATQNPEALSDAMALIGSVDNVYEDAYRQVRLAERQARRG